MSVQSVKAAKNRRKLFLKLAVVALLVCGAVWLVRSKKDVLVREGADFFQRMLSRETNMDVSIGAIHGSLAGEIRFEDVRLEDPALPAGLRMIFRAKEIQVRFRPLDFLTKKFDSKLHLSVRGAELYWRADVLLRKKRHFLRIARDWMLAQRRHLNIEVNDLKIVYGPDKHEFAGIRFDFGSDAFSLSFPLRHLNLLGMDVSTQLNVAGKFETGPLRAPDALAGRFSTEGTVVNWSPLPWEANFDFLLTQDGLRFHSIDLLGGIEVDGGVDFAKDGDIELSIDAEEYPLNNFEPFLRAAPKGSLEGSIDLSARLAGYWQAPNFEADVRIAGGRVGRNRFKAMDLHLYGVYPTVQIADSHMLLEDNSVMRFADKTVEFGSLFSGDLYKKLIAGADQDTVVMGEWEFKRPVGPRQRPEFRMQRQLGEHAGMYIRKFNEPSEEKLDSPDDHDTQFGLEYRLKGEGALKFEANEEERFVGVERKMSF